jgi:Domain of unknown function (DUF4136)
MRTGFVRAVVGVVVIGLTTIAVGDVMTDYNHQVSFSKFHTYSWGTIQTPNPSDGGLVKHAVDVQLQAKGWKSVGSGGDVTVFATGNVTSNDDTKSFYSSIGGGWGGVWGWGGWSWSQGWGGSVGEVGLGNISTSSPKPSNEAHLEVDIFESNSKNLVWRGLASGKTKQLGADIASMFKRFPPKASSAKAGGAKASAATASQQ